MAKEAVEDAWFQVVHVGALFGSGIPSSFIIHLWLPLFALSSLAVRLVYLIFRAVEWAQWFLKQGDAHPLKAIGIVATIIVFSKCNARQRRMGASVNLGAQLESQSGRSRRWEFYCFKD
jgi:hypothetical protein